MLFSIPSLCDRRSIYTLLSGSTHYEGYPPHLLFSIHLAVLLDNSPLYKVASPQGAVLVKTGAVGGGWSSCLFGKEELRVTGWTPPSTDYITVGILAHQLDQLRGSSNTRQIDYTSQSPVSYSATRCP